MQNVEKAALIGFSITTGQFASDARAEGVQGAVENLAIGELDSNVDMTPDIAGVIEAA